MSGYLQDRDRELPWPPVVLGFLLLALAPLGLFGFGVWGTLLPTGLVLLSPVLLAGAIGIVVGIRYEWWELRRVIHDGTVAISEPYSNLLAVLGGALATFAVVTELGVSPIVAASVVGIIAAVIVQRVAVAAYCGAFVGMTSPVLFGSYWHALAAAGLAGLLFVVVHPVFHGLGGKLGTTAFVGVTLVVVPSAGSFPHEPIPEQPVLLAVVGVAALAATITYTIHTHSTATPVLASGIVGLLGGMHLPTSFEATGGLLAAAAYSASFAGMTDPRRIPSGWWIGVTGVGVGLVVAFTAPFVGGSGGKLGTIAFGACLGVHGLLRLVHIYHITRTGYRPPQEETT